MPKKPSAPAPVAPSIPYGKRYGLNLPDNLSEIVVELFCFRHSWPVSKGGLGRFGHLKNCIRILWPKIELNDWLEAQLDSLCTYNYVGWAGCGASGKTFASALYSLVWWWSDSFHSAVILTSTSAKMVRKRIWPVIQRLYRESTLKHGNMVDSKTTLEAVRGDEMHAIFAKAVAEGSASKAAADIQGIHPKRILLIIDEGTDTPQAIYDVENNLKLGTLEFQMLVIGNPSSRFDPHGRFCTPKAGWPSVSVETDQWETKLGICVRFDAVKSPNVKAGKTIYPFLYTRENLISAKETKGLNDPFFWKYDRGFWPPDGISKSVISDALFIKFHASDHISFLSESITIAGLDPAFGGDRCILKFAKVGDTQGGPKRILFTETVQIELDASSGEPITFQIARKTVEACKERGVLPEHLAIDSSGNTGVPDVLATLWSNSIIRVGFGEKASDRPASDHDQRPSCEVYKNRVSEIWYSVREAVKADQIRGMDIPTMNEFTSREVDEDDRRLCLESKPDMKSRTGFSPDLADAAALVVEVARQIGSRTIVKSPGDKPWDKWAEQEMQRYSEENLYATSEVA